jgi:5-methylcytosine-specific restriction endonuclease McrA
MAVSLANLVRVRAQGKCEYCHLPESVSRLRHVIDHIIARQHHGATAAENLALACGECNRAKGPNLAGLDPMDGALTRLFNPR